MSQESILAELSIERQAQDAKFGDQSHFPDCDLDSGFMISGWNDGEWADRARAMCQTAFAEGHGAWDFILMEEVQEALAEIGKVDCHLREELVQVAAVCIAWIETIDKRGYVAVMGE